MKRKVVVSYAINGRGMGHLTRQLALLRWMRRIAGAAGTRLEVWVLTSSEADTLARREGVPSLKIPSKSMMRDAGLEPARYLAVARSWVLQTIAGLQPDLLLVDTFPGGTFGELAAALELAGRRALVARKVRDDFAADDAYRALLPLYDLVVTPEEGGGPVLIRDRQELPSREEARRALGVAGDRRAVLVTLGGGGDPAAGVTLPRLIDPLLARGWHVVVGAGPLYDGPERRGDGITWLDRYLAMELLPGLDAAVAAGGYNAFHELMHVGVPTVFLPQPRLADDQGERVDRAVAAGAGRRATSVDQVPDLLEDPGSGEAARALVPRNGAHGLAARLLTTILPADDVAAAAAAFAPELYHHASARALPPARLLELVRMLGPTPSELTGRRALLRELADEGHDVPELPRTSPAGLADVLEVLDRQDAPEPASRVLLDLHRRFRAAGSADLLAHGGRVLDALARFGDWPGAHALIRAVPTQRQMRLSTFADELCAWLDTERDLFDAQRALVRLEGLGTRPLAEVLLALRQRDPAEDERPLIGGGR
ncbi:MAG: hypothetical protein H6738_22775 [Alphaproteobacteria bacterium]|nr:hypothetical protein [Alphaproteobacteria bacterium]